MYLGYNTNGFAHHRLEDALTILAELGYRSVALTLDYHTLNPYDPALPPQLRTIKQILSEKGLRSVIETGARFLLDPRRKHSPTLIAPPERRKRRLNFLCRAVAIAADLGSDAVSFWSGRAEEIDDPQEQLDLLVHGCQALAAYATERGVRLAFEPEPGMVIDTMPRFAELFERVAHPAFGLTLDIGHLHCLGELPIVDHLRRWRHVLWNIHLEDMRHGVHDHLMFGEGEIDFDEVFAGLREIDYHGGVHVELSRHSHDAVATARASFAFLEAKAKSAGSTNEV